MPEVKDIIDYTMQNQPVEIMKSFNDIMAQRVNDAIADKRIDVAARMFNPNMNDEELEKFKSQYIELEGDDDIGDDGNEDTSTDTEEDTDINDDDLELSDDEWEELGIDDWDFEDDGESQDSENTDEE